MISARWLCHQFSHPPIDSNDATLERYAQVFILALIGSTLFTNKKGTHIRAIHAIDDVSSTSLTFGKELITAIEVE